MKKILFLNFNNIVKVEIRITGSYAGMCLFYKNLLRMYKNCQVPAGETDSPDLVVNIGTKFLRNTSINGEYFIDGNYIYIKHRRKIISTEVEILNISNAITKVNIRTNIFGKFIFPTVVINSLIGLKSNLKGVCFVHSSSVSLNAGAVLLAGSGSSGKTSILIKSSEKNFNLVADDATFVGNKEVYSFIRPMSLEYYHQKLLHFSLSIKKKLEFIAKKVLSVITCKYITLLTDIDANFFFDNRTDGNAELKKVYYLTKGEKFKIEPFEDKLLLAKEIINNTRYIYDFSVRLSNAFAETGKNIYFSNYWDTMENNLFNNIKEVPCYKVVTPFFVDSSTFERIFEDMKKTLGA